MNVEIGRQSIIILFWKYIGFSPALHLQILLKVLAKIKFQEEAEKPVPGPVRTSGSSLRYLPGRNSTILIKCNVPQLVFGLFREAYIGVKKQFFVFLILGDSYETLTCQ
jgi:hypothetical protein